jgi:hypothetical protein
MLLSGIINRKTFITLKWLYKVTNIFVSNNEILFAMQNCNALLLKQEYIPHNSVK